MLLEETRPLRRLMLLNKFLDREIKILSMEQSLQESTQEQLNRSQREYFLREQLKVIQAELGEDSDSEIDEYRERILKIGFDKEIEEKLLKEVSRRHSRTAPPRPLFCAIILTFALNCPGKRPPKK